MAEQELHSQEEFTVPGELSFCEELRGMATSGEEPLHSGTAMDSLLMFPGCRVVSIR